MKLKKPKNKEGSQFRKLLLSTHENPKNAADVLHKVNWVVVAVDDDDACVECKRGFSVHKVSLNGRNIWALKKR